MIHAQKNSQGARLVSISISRLWVANLQNRQLWGKISPLSDRLMVGLRPLEACILVRIQVRQHFGKLSASHAPTSSQIDNTPLLENSLLFWYTQFMAEPQRRLPKTFLFFITGAIAGGVVVWASLNFTQTKTPLLNKPIRLNTANERFVSPLLACGTDAANLSPIFQPLQKKLGKTVASLVSDGTVQKASVYFKDLTSGEWIDIGENEKFYTASLGKVPIMIAYFRLAESDPAILQKKIYYPGGNDLNQQQEIQPTTPIVAGTSYTTQELIEKMIWYSDNNAANLLTNNIDQGLLRSVYNDLEIPILDNVTTDNLDYMTTKNFSLFFRVLYNATYLSREYSEKALEVLTGTDFNKGILAGIPASTTVSHKFGLTSVARNGSINERELHECGIVYHSRHPYFVCVMTRSSNSLPAIEQSLKTISGEIFRTVDSDYKN